MAKQKKRKTIRKKKVQPPPPPVRRRLATLRPVKYLTLQEELEHYRQIYSYCSYWAHEAKNQIERLENELCQ